MNRRTDSRKLSSTGPRPCSNSPSQRPCSACSPARVAFSVNGTALPQEKGAWANARSQTRHPSRPFEGFIVGVAFTFHETDRILLQWKKNHVAHTLLAKLYCKYRLSIYTGDQRSVTEMKATCSPRISIWLTCLSQVSTPFSVPSTTTFGGITIGPMSFHSRGGTNSSPGNRHDVDNADSTVP